MTLHTITEHLDGLPSIEDGLYGTRALENLLGRVGKILLHMDGLHGVQREYCDDKLLLTRAKKENCLLLDLGHVVRIYFGDDYFDLHLDTKISSDRPHLLTILVEAARKEIEGNSLM